MPAANLKGAMAAYEAGAHAIVIPLSVSDCHSRANVNKGTLEHIAAIGDIIEWLRLRHGLCVSISRGVGVRLSSWQAALH